MKMAKALKADDLKNLRGARKAPMPEFMAPQLSTLVKEPPSGEGWLHEIKFDGYRMVCHLNHNEVRFWSRNQKDWSIKFPGVAKAIKTIPATTAVLDGEIVVMDANGRTSFQKLQQA